MKQYNLTIELTVFHSTKFPNCNFNVIKQSDLNAQSIFKINTYKGPLCKHEYLCSRYNVWLLYTMYSGYMQCNLKHKLKE